ncbi:TetR/AcrR family transcriptional regulator [Desulforhabdus sp. TSK]|uniref:TetR/AcrR family transcriptional regulator n=1 Tax=Desulforhabdus sp. TSK TaxID=2925014 RepID=UPI001FC88D98|nr:TetR/AcrR family transcriptional regulator [Desulforhabdus sp. TSK]GKT08285.1 TetR family transcriptional regulator [Desulforhabdus sp. TSK]
MSVKKFATEIRREQIAQAAVELIASQGMKGFNMAGLARQVGVAPSAIYHHFKNKDEVIEAVLDHLQNRLLGNVRSVLSMTPHPLDQLKQLLAAHVELVVGHSAMPRILFSEDIYGGKSEHRSRLKDIIMRYISELASIFRQGQQVRSIRPELDPEALAVMFLGLLQPTAILWHLSDGEFDAKKQVEKGWSIFAEAIRP